MRLSVQWRHSEAEPAYSGVGIMAVPAELQCSPHALQFSAHVGQDAPLRFTLFNPHPAQRIAFKVSSMCIDAPRGPRPPADRG